MYYRISTSISRWPWRRRKSLTSDASGGQRWGQSSRGGLAPLVSSRYRRATAFVFSAARSDAPRHLVGTARFPDEALTRRTKSGRRFVPPTGPATKPRSGQERPPRQGRVAAPALTPEGVAPARSARPPDAGEMTGRKQLQVSVPTRVARRNLTSN